MIRYFTLLVASLVIGCSSDISDYRQAEPTFDLFGYFSGETIAWGMIQDRSGKLQRRFEVALNGRIEGNVLTLEEDFVFDDGEKTRRVWVITRSGDNRYSGRAEDIIGIAEGEEQGNALRWRYDFELPYGDGTTKVHFDDWLYRVDERHLFNRTSITKFGVEVAELTLFFQKPEAD